MSQPTVKKIFKKKGGNLPSWTRSEDTKIIECVLNPKSQGNPTSLSFWSRCRENGMDLPKRSDESLKSRFSRVMKNIDSLKLDDEKRHALMFKADNKKAEKRKDVNGSSSDSDPEAQGKPSLPKVIKPSSASSEIETVDLSGDEQGKCGTSAADPKVDHLSETAISSPTTVSLPSGGSSCVSEEVEEYQKFYTSMLVEIFDCEFSSERIDWYKTQTRRIINLHYLLPWIQRDEGLEGKTDLVDLKEKLACIIETTMSESADTSMKEAGMFLKEFVEDANIMIGIHRKKEMNAQLKADEAKRVDKEVDNAPPADGKRNERDLDLQMTQKLGQVTPTL